MDIVHEIPEQLYLYAHASLEGTPPEQLYPSLASHIATCSTCQATLAELLEAGQMVFEGKAQLSFGLPKPNLSRLVRPRQSAQQSFKPWFVDALGRFWFTFSESLLTSMRPSPLVGAARGIGASLLYSYELEPDSVTDMELQLEVFADETSAENVCLRVNLFDASRDPFEQSGRQIKLIAGEHAYEAETNETGSCDFMHIPMEELAQLQVSISPSEEETN